MTVSTSWLSVVLSLVLAIAPAATARSASTSAATPTLKIVQIDATGHVTTTNGTKLDVTMYSRYLVGSGGGTFRISLNSAGTPGANAASGPFGEEHDWTFGMAGTGLVTVDRTGNARLRLGRHQLGRFGSIDLTMSPGGPGPDEGCSEGRRFPTYHERVSGEVSFDTRTGQRGWGVAGGSARSVGLSGHTQVLAEYNGPVCTPTGHFRHAATPCDGLVTWLTDEIAASDGRSGSFSGGVERLDGRLIGYIRAGAERSLAAPKRASRDDMMTVRAPRPTVSGHDAGGTTTLTVTTSGHRASGSMALSTSRAPVTATATCGPHDRTTMTRDDWRGRLVASGAPLTLRTKLFAPLRTRHAHVEFSRQVGG